MGPEVRVASAAYQPEPKAAAAARRFVRDTLQAWVVTGAADGYGLVDDAVLLTSELVTNAVVHAGTPVHVVAQRLGHANVAMTLNVYAHALPNMQQDAAARLGALLHG